MQNTPPEGTLPRCEHGVYNAGKPGDKTKYCSGCFAPEKGSIRHLRYAPIDLPYLFDPT